MRMGSNSAQVKGQDSEQFGANLLNMVLLTLRDESVDQPTKIKMIKSLSSALEESPFLCEQVFAKYQKGDAFDIALQSIESSNEFYMVEGLVDILVTTVSHVGVGVEHTQRMITMLTRPGRWPPFALELFRGLHLMALNETASRSAIGGGGAAHHEPAKQRPWLVGQSRDFSMFQFDGDTNGLFLGGANAWPFERGYAFETWIWQKPGEVGEGKTPTYLFRVLSGEGGSKGSSGTAALELWLHEGHLVLHSVQSTGRSRCRCVTEVPAGEWVHVVVSHARNGLLLPSEVSFWVQGQFSNQRLNYPAEFHAVRLYVGCSGWGQDAAAAGRSVGWPARRPVNSARAFRGLVRTVRVYRGCLRPGEAAALFATDSTGPHVDGVSRDAFLSAHPRSALRGAPALPALPTSAAVMFGGLAPAGRMDLCGAIDCIGQVGAAIGLSPGEASRSTAWLPLPWLIPGRSARRLASDASDASDVGQDLGEGSGAKKQEREHAHSCCCWLPPSLPPSLPSSSLAPYCPPSLPPSVTRLHTRPHARTHARIRTRAHNRRHTLC